MTEMVPTLINGRWELLLPKHRADRPEWPWWEAQRLAAEHHVIYRWQHKRPVVYCVGAEEGDFPALYASWGADVVLAEPNPRVWPNIKAIFEANGLEGRILKSWVGFFGDQDIPGLSVPWEQFPPCTSGEVIGDHGFRNLWERDPQDEDASPVVSIDSFVAAGVRDKLIPDVITIDVEGAELRVLKGASTVLRVAKPAVFISIHPSFMHAYYDDEGPDTQEKLLAFMRSHGYEERFLCEDHEEHWFFQHPDNRRMRLT